MGPSTGWPRAPPAPAPRRSRRSSSRLTSAPPGWRSASPISSGRLIEHVAEPVDIADGPEVVLGRVEEVAGGLLVPGRARPADLGRRHRRARPGRVLLGSARRPAHHAGLGRLPDPRADVAPLVGPHLGGQRRQPAGPRRAAHESGRRRCPGHPVRQDRHRDRGGPRVGRPAAPRPQRLRRGHRPRGRRRSGERHLPLRQRRLPGGHRRWRGAGARGAPPGGERRQPGDGRDPRRHRHADRCRRDDRRGAR